MQSIRLTFESYLRRISDQPRKWIELFDQGGPEGMAALNHFSNLLHRYHAESGFDSEPALGLVDLRFAASRALQSSEDDYELLRARALRLCLDEAIVPSKIANAFAAAFEGLRLPPEWVQRLESDGPLNCVCWACQLFRG